MDRPILCKMQYFAVCNRYFATMTGIGAGAVAQPTGALSATSVNTAA